MEYRGSVVEALQQETGKWRAKITRSSGKPLITGRKKLWRFETAVDAERASTALPMALQAIDAGTFSNAAPPRERFWRRAEGKLARGRQLPAARDGKNIL